MSQKEIKHDTIELKEKFNILSAIKFVTKVLLSKIFNEFLF